ncbi:hypothetical protein PENTCL1PPCAC_29142, partial [Pristionchus entomophagus]
QVHFICMVTSYGSHLVSAAFFGVAILAHLPVAEISTFTGLMATNLAFHLYHLTRLNMHLIDKLPSYLSFVFVVLIIIILFPIPVVACTVIVAAIAITHLFWISYEVSKLIARWFWVLTGLVYLLGLVLQAVYWGLRLVGIQESYSWEAAAIAAIAVVSFATHNVLTQCGIPIFSRRSETRN